MSDPAKRERAALDVLTLLPEWWAVGPTSYDPGTGRWSYAARGPHPGCGKHPETITGTGEDELAAMIVTIDVTREAGTRWDQNLSGYRGEVGFAFSAEPFVQIGCVIKVLGL